MSLYAAQLLPRYQIVELRCVEPHWTVQCEPSTCELLVMSCVIATRAALGGVGPSSSGYVRLSFRQDVHDGTLGEELASKAASCDGWKSFGPAAKATAGCPSWDRVV